MYRILICVVLGLQCVCAFSREESNDLNKYFSHTRDRNGGTSPRTIGGEEVLPHTYPFTATLTIFKHSSTYFCGGTLISANLVLTAAHCVEMLPDYIYVGLGLHNRSALDSEGIVLPTINYVIHQKWDTELFDNDIALIRLPQNVTFNFHIQPVALATGSDKYEGRGAIVLGWGKTETENLSSVLRRVNTTVLTNTDCSNSNENYEQIITSSHICTSGVGPVGTCFGDSGGPLIVNGVQVGIVSFGTDDCILGLPSVFTRVSEFSDWIEENSAN